MDDPTVVDQPDHSPDSELRTSGSAVAHEASAFEDAPDPLVVTDRAGHVVGANRAARALAPHRGEGIGDVSRSIELWFAPDDRPQATRSIAALGDGTATQCDLHAEVVARGTAVKVWARAVSALDPATARRRILWSLRVLEDEEVALHRLARASALKDSYLLAVAHDLRSPVSVIEGTVALVREQVGDGAAVHQLLDVLERSIGSVRQVIADVLDVERMEHGALAVLRRRTDLHRLVRRSLNEARPSSPVALHVAPGPALIDPGLTERILVNLLTNADHHNRPGETARLTP